MQPIKKLITWLQNHTDDEHYLFALKDLRALYPELSDSAFKTLISRAVTGGHMARVCRGIYTYMRAIPSHGLLLFHTAGLLRSKEFNYISLETVLSDAGVISQVPINWISVMSSGRSHIISCGNFGTIEFIHTSQTPSSLTNELSYDARCMMWRASIPLALRDMKATHRDLNLIDWDTAHEFIR